MTINWSTLTQVLVAIQSSLDGDVSLPTLARMAGVSPWQLQRAFTAALGESPRACVERLRLERAAFRMLVQDASLLDIALDCGFQSAETFTRAFRRRYGQPPQTWRRQRWTHLATATERETDATVATSAFGLSGTRLVHLHSLHLATVRHLGPYEDVPESLFDTLADWADRRQLPAPRLWLGIGHDAPSTTPAAQRRFDAALVVGAAFASDGDVVHRVLPGGSFALTTHVGDYASLPLAYAQILPRLLANRDWTVVGLPAVEFYHCARMSVHAALNHTDICLPIALRQGATIRD